MESFKDITLSEWQKTKKPLNDIIIQGSVTDHSDSWTPWTIGMQYSYCKLSEEEQKSIQVGSHNKLILCAINGNTDKRRRGNNVICRKKIIETLGINEIFNEWINPIEHYKKVANYKFLVSPEGNGIDCHRHYEALLCGCIPIVERNKLIEEKYKNMPVLYTTDYSEINAEYLNKKYNEMLEKKYDFSSLFLSTYDMNTQEQIKKSGNYWCKLLSNKSCY